LGEFWPQNWAIVLCEQFFSEKYKSSLYKEQLCFRGKTYVLILTKNGLGYILGDFVTNSSGHPVSVTYIAAF
jgi:hypothetical protein